MADPRKYVAGSSSLVLGCDSYTQSAELSDREFIMGMNVVCRGGIVQTRPGTRTVFCLPDGNFQGCKLFTPSNGISQLVFVVDGKVYVSSSPFTSYTRLSAIQFSNTSKYIAWAVCLKSTDYDLQGNLIPVDNPYSVLVMQDGLSRAAYWDGNTAAHLNPATPDFPDQTDVVPGFTETPIGLWMIWSGNRLWVSRGNQIFASDIGNPLKFTEALYLNEARAFYLSGDCTGMIEVPTDGNTSKGFIAFTENDGTLFQSYIQDRTLWLATPLFQNTIIPTMGCVAPRSLVTQYGLNWWFGPRGLTNINAALRQNITSRIDYQDNEMFASKAYLGPDLSGICGSFYENYLLMSVPSQDELNRHTWVLDQAPFEDNAPAWCGFWSGWRPIEWTRGLVTGAERIFFGSVDYDGKNRIWEAMLPERTDNGVSITCYAQLRDHAAGNLDPKAYEWSKFFLSQIFGDVDLNVYVASTKGGYQFQKGYHIVASPGQIYDNVEYSEAGPYMIGNIVQSRVIRTPDATGDNDCNACGVESQEGNLIDYAFSHLLVWSGQMGIRAYQLHMREELDKDRGECEEPEVGPRSLNAAGCSGLELLIGTQVFEVFTARADGSATLGNGEEVLINRLGFSIISPANAQAVAQQTVVAVQQQLEGQDLEPGVYGEGDLPFPDGGAGIQADGDAGGALEGGSFPVIVEPPLDAIQEPPTVIQQPENVSINEGENAAFYIAAEGMLPLAYQWQVDDGGGWMDVANGGVYSGATTQALTITAATLGMDTYLYRCRVTNEVGVDYSDSAVLAVASAGCVGSPWTPFDPGPENGGVIPIADQDVLTAMYGGDSLTSGVAAGEYTSSVPVALGGSGAVGAATAFSVCFASTGVKTFTIGITGGPYTPSFSDLLSLALYSEDGLTLIDSSGNLDPGDFSGPLTVTVPVAGQYRIIAKFARELSGPGSVDFDLSYTLGVGDGIVEIL